MNGKQAKRLRRMVSSRNARDTNIAVYQPTKSIRVFEKTPIPGLPVKSAIFLGQLKLTNECLRHQYHQLRKSFKMLQHQVKGRILWTHQK